MQLLLAETPLYLWPLNGRYLLRDVTGGVDASSSDVNLVDDPLSLAQDFQDKLPPELSGIQQAQTYRLEGSETSYIDIPNINMPYDYTVLEFVRPQTTGPIFRWDDGNKGDRFIFKDGALKYKNFGDGGSLDGLGMEAGEELVRMSVVLWLA